MAIKKYHIGLVLNDRKRIIEEVGSNKYGQKTFLWECVLCQNKFGPSTGTDINRSKYSKCCPRKLDEKKNYKGYKEITGSKLTQIKDSARKRGLEYSVDGEYLWSVWLDQEGRCAYTNKKLSHGKDASLDRIDPSKGYIRGNVQWVQWIINRMKLNLSHKEFIDICSQITERRKVYNGKHDLVT